MLNDEDDHANEDDNYYHHHHHWRCRRVRIWVPLNTPLHIASYRKREKQMMKYCSESAASYGQERRFLVVVTMA